MEVPLIWKFSVDGNNQVKSVLNDLHTAHQRGQIDDLELADSKAKLARESNKLSNSYRYENQILMSAHPNINKVSRSLSSLASVSRTLLSIVNAVNIAQLVAQGQDSTSIDLTNQLAEAHREFNRALTAEDKQAAAEKIAFLTAKLKEHEQQVDFNKITNGFIIFSTAIFGINGALKFFKDNPKLLLTIATGIRAIGASMATALIPFLPLIGAALMFAAGIALIGAAIEKFQGKDGPFSALVDGAVEFLGLRDSFFEIGRFFMETLPTAIRDIGVIFTAVWENMIVFFRNIINGFISGVESLANAVIEALNGVIRAYNATAGKILGTIGLISGVSLPRLQTNGNFTSNNQVSQPVSTSSNNVQGPSNTYITVQGSILAERQLLNLVDNKLKSDYKNSGFTGFQ